MSEQRKPKRLDDEGAAMFWEAATNSDLHVLKRDHLQAREDRKRLADRLQERVNVCCTSDRRCMWCVRDLALLAEADPQ